MGHTAFLLTCRITKRLIGAHRSVIDYVRLVIAKATGETLVPGIATRVISSKRFASQANSKVVLSDHLVASLEVALNHCRRRIRFTNPKWKKQNVDPISAIQTDWQGSAANTPKAIDFQDLHESRTRRGVSCIGGGDWLRSSDLVSYYQNSCAET